MDEELFNVVQFLSDEEYEFTKRNVTAEEAVKALKHYATSVSAKIGITKRVIITDAGDSICAEWIWGKGIVFPPPKKEGE